MKFYTATQEVIRNRKQHLSELKIFSTGHDTSFNIFENVLKMYYCMKFIFAHFWIEKKILTEKESNEKELKLKVYNI